MAGRTPAVLVADMGMDGAYSATQAGAATSVTLTVYPNGSWIVTFGAGDTPSGTPTSGTWATGGDDAGQDYEVQFTTAGEVGAPVVTNDASSFTRISAPLTITVAKTLANALADVTINFRAVGTAATTLTETSQFQANGA